MKKTASFFYILLTSFLLSSNTNHAMDRQAPHVNESLSPALFTTRMPISPFGRSVINRLKSILEQDKISEKDIYCLEINLAFLQKERLPVDEVFEKFFVPQLILLEEKSSPVSSTLEAYDISTSDVLEKAVKKIKTDKSSLADYIGQLRSKRPAHTFLNKLFKKYHEAYGEFFVVDCDKHPKLKPHRPYINSAITTLVPKEHIGWQKIIAAQEERLEIEREARLERKRARRADRIRAESPTDELSLMDELWPRGG